MQEYHTKEALHQKDIAELKQLFIEENAKLQQGLLDGMLWNDLMSLRKYITAIGVAIDVKAKEIITGK